LDFRDVQIPDSVSISALRNVYVHNSFGVSLNFTRASENVTDSTSAASQTILNRF